MKHCLPLARPLVGSVTLIALTILGFSFVASAQTSDQGPALRVASAFPAPAPASAAYRAPAIPLALDPPLPPAARDKKEFGGWYFGGHGGVPFSGFEAAGHTAALSTCFDKSTGQALPCDEVLVNQVSGIFVPTRGIIIVPGTLVAVPAITVGGSVDFTVPSCSTPPPYVCTGNRSLTTIDGVAKTSPGSRSKGFLGGGQIGYSHQFVKLVLGGEADYSGSTTNGAAQALVPMFATELTNCVGPGFVNPCTPSILTYSRQVSSDWSASLRARAGWVWGRTLIYATGGPVIASVAVKAVDTFEQTLSNGQDCPCGPSHGSAQRGTGIVGFTVISTSQDSHIQVGWTAGLGFERSLWRRFRWGAEYRHTDTGSKSYPGTTPTSATINPAGNNSFSVSSDTIIAPQAPFAANQTGFFAGGVFSPPTRVSYIDDRIAARLNFHF